jgi:fructose-1,6-bisphosphatase/inositol monophosphatase family enzyme
MPFAGAVYDPAACWLFTACAGRGAWLNDRPLYAGADIPVEPRRRRPSIALRLCAVALGGRGVIHERDASLMDVAGAAAIVMEAGAVLTSASGEPLFPHWPAAAPSMRIALVAGHPACHQEALRGVVGRR